MKLLTAKMEKKLQNSDMQYEIQLHRRNVKYDSNDIKHYSKHSL